MTLTGSDRRGAPNGFALLEALVAMVIVAGVGVALYALINTGINGLIKAESHITTTSLQPHVLGWVRTIDLTTLPETQSSSITFWQDGHPVRAEARLERIHGPSLATTRNGDPGLHRLALYNVTITLYEDQRRLDEIRTRRVASYQFAKPPQI